MNTLQKQIKYWKTSAKKNLEAAETLYKAKQFDRELNLLGDLNSLFRRDDIDLVVLNRAVPLISYHAVIKGKKFMPTINKK